MIEYHVHDDRLTLKYMEQLPDKLVARLDRAIGVQTLALSRVAIGRLSGLKNPSGKLVAAVRRGTYKVHDKAKFRIVGVVGVKGADKQTMIAAGVQEFGASLPARVLEARDQRALKFQIGVADFYRKSVQLPASTIPRLSFLRGAMAQLKPAIQAAMNDAVQIELTGN